MFVASVHVQPEWWILRILDLLSLAGTNWWSLSTKPSQKRPARPRFNHSAPNQDSCSICKMNRKTAMSIVNHQTHCPTVYLSSNNYGFQGKKHRKTFCGGAGLLGTLGAWVDVNIPMDHEKCIEMWECFQPSIQQIINWIHKVNITMTSLFQNPKGANKDKLKICKLFQSAWLFLLNKSSFTIVHSLLYKSDAILGAIFPNGICKHPSTSVCSVLVANLPSGTCLKWWNNPIDHSGVWNTQWTGLKLNLLSWTEGHAPILIKLLQMLRLIGVRHATPGDTGPFAVFSSGTRLWL